MSARRKLGNSITGDCPPPPIFFPFSVLPFSVSPVRSILKDWGPTQCAAGYTGACVGPRQSISIHFYWWGGHESAFISRAKRLIYFSQGIKGHCKNALCSLSNIKRVRRHKRIPVVTESEDHYRTRQQRRGKRRRAKCGDRQEEIVLRRNTVKEVG